MIDDPEELRLRDAVVTLALRYREDDKFGGELDKAVDRLNDYHRAKAPAPVVPEPRCEPAEKDRTPGSSHWLKSPHASKSNGGFSCFVWTESSGGGWSTYGGFIAADLAVRQGYVYHSPAKPDLRVEPTDGAIDALQREHLPFSTASEIGPCVYRAIVRNALAHFSAPAEPAITDALLAQLRSLALTREPGVYLTDARKIIADRTK